MTPQLQAAIQQAHRLSDAGQRDRAIAAYETILRSEPRLPEIWYELAWLLKQRGRHDEALQAYGEALRHGVDKPEEVHLNRAVIQTDHLHDHAAAEASLQQALQIRPDYLAAHLNLGNLYEEQGRKDAAANCYRQILAHGAGAQPAPLQLEALARLVALEAPTNAQDLNLQRLQQCADGSPGLDDSTRANLYFALGRSYERLADFPAAHQAFARANQCAARTGPAYQPAALSRWIDSLIETLPLDLPDQLVDDGAAPRPLFICGMFRSGSTLIEQVLAAHPAVVAGGELDLLPRLASGPLAPYPAGLARLDPAQARQLSDAYRQHLARLIPAERTGVSLVSDKRPDNFLLLALIVRLFPQARIIHTTRDPLDNGLSIFQQHLDQRVAPHSSDLSAIGHYYGEYRRFMATARQRLGERLIDFDYDAFVADPEPALRRLLHVLQLPWDDGLLEFHARRSTVKTASYWQVRQPLYRDASGRWRHYAEVLAPLRQALRAAGVNVP